MDTVTRRLSACIGYSIRQAQRGGRSDVAQPLWQALYVVTTPDKTPKPISLFSALGLDGRHREVNGVAETHCGPGLTVEQGGIPLTSTDPFTTLQAATAGSQVSTQTEEPVLTVTECMNLVQEAVKNTVAKTVVPLQTAVDQLQKRQQCQTEALEAAERALQKTVQPACDETRELIQHNTRQRATSPAHALTDNLVGPASPAERMPTKEQRREARKMELLARMHQ